MAFSKQLATLKKTSVKQTSTEKVESRNSIALTSQNITIFTLQNTYN